jgi:hypothetical protein
MRTALPLLAAGVFLVAALVMSGPLEAIIPAGSAGVLEPADRGFDEIRLILAEVLYLELDDYHHIMMYQGYDWTAISDYLPQIWLIVRLKPDFWQAYQDGAYHLAVNLGSTTEGLRLLEEGIANCPGNLDLLWQNVVIRWRTGTGRPRERLQACLEYSRAVRDLGLPDPHPVELRNAALISTWIMEEGTGTRDSLTSARYSRRADILNLVIRAGDRPSS